MTAPQPQLDQVPQTVKQLEQGDASGLRTLLHGDSEQDRDAILKAVRDQFNQNNPVAKGSTPTLELGFRTQAGQETESVRINGKSVFASDLDINSLKRQDWVNGKQVGQPESVVGAQPNLDVPQFTQLLEAHTDSGDQQALQMLGGLGSQEQRIQALQLASVLNHQHYNAGSTTSYLEFNSSTGKGIPGDTEVSLVRNLPGWGPFSSGTLIYDERYTLGADAPQIIDNQSRKPPK